MAKMIMQATSWDELLEKLGTIHVGYAGVSNGHLAYAPLKDGVFIDTNPKVICELIG